MKTILTTLFSIAALSLTTLSQNADCNHSGAVILEKPVSGLRAEVLALDWTQCEGRFHYTFGTDGSFTLDGTIMGGSWAVEGDELVLRWSGNWIVDHLKFDAAKKLFVHTKGEKLNLLGADASVRLAVNRAGVR